MGVASNRPTETEKKSLQDSSSVYVVADIAASEIFSHKNIRVIRPELGSPTKYLDVMNRSYLAKWQ